MNTMDDRRPSAELSTDEVVAYLFQAIRVRELKTIEAVHALYDEFFPDMPEGRWDHHVRALANCLHSR